jgi:hypothetical protein
VLVTYDKDRIGREQFETSYLLKKIDQAGVRIFEAKGTGRALTFDSPIDKMVMSVLGFAEELERDKARTRTRDALQRKAERGHVAGGSCFGYDNVVVTDEAGRRSHVVRRVNEAEAAVVRRIFTLTAEEIGLRKIADRLNQDGDLAPTPRRAGGPRGWAPSSIREILHRELYRGAIVWGRRQKRDKWGQHRVTQRDASTWTRGHDEALRIVPEELWEAAHARLAGVRAVYLRGTKGRLWGPPANGIESRWLLTGFGRCGRCGGTMEARSADWRHSQARQRAHFYQCATYVRRGASICSNRLTLPAERAHAAVLDAIEAEVLHPDVVAAALAEAMDELRRPRTLDADHAAALKAEVRALDDQIANLAATASAAGPLPSLVAALQAAEGRKAEIMRTLKPARATSADAAMLQKLLDDWRGMFRSNWPSPARFSRSSSTANAWCSRPRLRGPGGISWRPAPSTRCRLVQG